MSFQGRCLVVRNQRLAEVHCVPSLLLSGGILPAAHDTTERRIASAVGKRVSEVFRRVPAQQVVQIVQMHPEQAFKSMVMPH